MFGRSTDGIPPSAKPIGTRAKLALLFFQKGLACLLAFLLACLLACLLVCLCLCLLVCLLSCSLCFPACLLAFVFSLFACMFAYLLAFLLCLFLGLLVCLLFVDCKMGFFSSFCASALIRQGLEDDGFWADVRVPGAVSSGWATRCRVHDPWRCMAYGASACNVFWIGSLISRTHCSVRAFPPLRVVFEAFALFGSAADFFRPQTVGR